jgi:hypothetical protein
MEYWSNGFLGTSEYGSLPLEALLHNPNTPVLHYSVTPFFKDHRQTTPRRPIWAGQRMISLRCLVRTAVSTNELIET